MSKRNLFEYRVARLPCAPFEEVEVATTDADITSTWTESVAVTETG